MSSEDYKPAGKLPSLTPRTVDELADTVVPWSLVRPEGNESCRWRCVDGRWVSLSLGTGDEIGSVVVAHSSGERQVVDSYEGALELARSWRTW